MSDDLQEAVAALDRTYPDGWRSGDKTTDALTVLLARDLRRLLESVFTGSRRG
jgi:hypothetical protein